MRCRPTALLLALAAVACGVFQGAQAQILAPPDVSAAAGGYLLSAEKGSRCMVLLRTVPVEGGFAVGFPAHCRLALPVLVTTVAWSVERVTGPPHGRIRFHGANGRVLLDFDRDAPVDAVMARDEAGLEHTLSPADGRTLAQRFGQPAPARGRVAARVIPGPATAPAGQSDVTLMHSAVGSYGLLRGKDRPSGCMLTLSAPLTGDARAIIHPGCPDRGLQIFTVDRWSIAEGTLWLMNARGQKLSFDRNRQGGWEKSAGQGEPLLLIRTP